MDPLLESLVAVAKNDMSVGRMLESLIVFAVVWFRLRPHLKKIEDRLLGIEYAVNQGFSEGNKRFENIETRVKRIENRFKFEEEITT